MTTAKALKILNKGSRKYTPAEAEAMVKKLRELAIIQLRTIPPKVVDTDS